MNKSQFISFLQSPVQLSGNDGTLLEGVVTEFPYFQSARLLYLKYLHNTQSIHFNNQLKYAAAYAGDRKLLYGLVNIVRSQELVVRSEEPKPLTEPVIAKGNTIQANEPTISQPTISIDIGNELRTKQEPLDIDKLNILEKEVLRTAIDASIALEVDAVTKELKDAGLINEVKDQLEHKSNTEEPRTKNPEPATHNPEHNNFFDWLNPVDTKVEEIPSSAEVRREYDKKKMGDLIDQFIKNEPRISKPQHQFYSPENIATKSSTEDYTLVTETLAQVYERQGNIPKAIKTYETLSLKYPGKKSIFAARIAELKEKISHSK